MLKNEELIIRMSFDQKLRLIISSRLYESSSVDNYKFPVFSLSANPLSGKAGAYQTLFPSDNTLCRTFDMPLIREVYRAVGNEAKAAAENAYFNVSNDLNRENSSEDYFLSGNFAAQKIGGVASAGVLVNFESSSADGAKESLKLFESCVFGGAQPASVLVHSIEEAEKLPPEYRFGGLLYGAASETEEVARYLFYGCSLVFLKRDISEELFPRLKTLTELYKKSESEYSARKITLAEFDRRKRCGEILDERIVDRACDDVISALLNLRAQTPASVDGARSSLDIGRDALFNERLHDKLARLAAAESVVLLENKGGILPLDFKTKVAVIGEYAKNADYQTELVKTTPTAVRLPFEVLNDFDIETVGYAHGYAKGQRGRGDLIASATELCAQADCALVYLSAAKGAKELPEGQRELLDELSAKKIKYIAVVSADGAIDMPFADRAAAILFTGRGGQSVHAAVADILTGEVCPSGKLAETFPAVLSEKEGYASVSGYTDRDNVRFAFGHGLSYTSFEYRNLTVTENGVSFTAVNVGGCDGYVVPQMYISNVATSSSFKHRLLRGFKRTFIGKGDAVKVEIPFDAGTFRTYDEENGVYRVEGGSYEIRIGESAADIRLKGEITLKEHVFGKYDALREDVTDDIMPVGFTRTREEEAVTREKKKLSFGLRLFFALMVTLYYDGMYGALLYVNIPEENFILCAVLAALLAVGNVFALIYIIVISKRRRLQRRLYPKEVLGDIVERVGCFKEIAKISYEEPVPAPAPEIEEEQPEEQQPDKDVKAQYAAAFGEEERIAPVYEKKASFAELCDNFRAFMLYKGVSVEASSVRALIAAITAGKAVYVNCANAQILPEFTAALNAYFGNTAYTAAGDNWDEPEDLLWVEEAEAFVTSDFANTLNSACLTPDKNIAVVLAGVKGANLKKYFGDFILHSVYPSEERAIELSDELTLVLPDNITYVLVAAEGERELPPELSKAFIHVDVIASAAEGEFPEAEAKNVTRAALNEMVSEVRERCFLSEKCWKRIDELTEAVNATGRFAIGNKDVQSLEKFTSVIIDCGGDENEALVCAFTSKIVPLLKNTDIYRGENGGATLVGMIEKIFGDEDITFIRKALNG